MSRLTLSTTETAASFQTPVEILKNIAVAMVGRTVDVRASDWEVTHGVVSGVRIEAGRPKIVVGGAWYDMDQVLRVATSPFKH
jgi:hypothetical protein